MKSQTKERLIAEIAKQIDDLFIEMMTGGPRKPKRQTALCVRNGGFVILEVGDDGKVIEPAPPCCYGNGLHAPNCKTWGNLT